MASPKMAISEAPSSIAGDHPPSTKKIEHRKTMSPRRFPPPWLYPTAPRPAAAPTMITQVSINFSTRSFDDRRPFREFAFDEVGRRLGCTVRRWIDAGLFQRGGHRRIGQRFVDGRVELVDDRLWRAGRGEKHVPGVAFESRQTLLLQSRQIRHRGHALCRPGAKRTELTRFCQRQRS